MKCCKKTYCVFEGRWAATRAFPESITQVKTTSILQASTPRNPWAFTRCCCTRLLMRTRSWGGAACTEWLFPPLGRRRGMAGMMPRPLCISDSQDKRRPPARQSCLSVVTSSPRRFSARSRQNRLFRKRKPVSTYKFGACCPTRPPACAWGGFTPQFVPVLPRSVNLGKRRQG